jgi:RNA polymerase sigma-70 factor (ECF subfamily)
MLAGVDLSALDDAGLMCLYADGEVAAFEQLYARHRAPLWRFLLRNLRDEAATADVFQETWARVVANRERYRPTAAYGTWRYRIAHNCCVDHWRRSGRAARRHVDAEAVPLESVPDERSAGPAEQAASEQQLAALEAAIAALPDEQRSAFLMYVEAGLSIADIAAATAVGPETAKSRLRYATAKLREAMSPGERGNPT